MTLPDLTDAELGAIYHEAAEDDGPIGELARALMELAEEWEIPLPEPGTPWERDELIESARRKVDGEGREPWEGVA